MNIDSVFEAIEYNYSHVVEVAKGLAENLPHYTSELLTQAYNNFLHTVHLANELLPNNLRYKTTEISNHLAQELDEFGFAIEGEDDTTTSTDTGTATKTSYTWYILAILFVLIMAVFYRYKYK